SLLHETVSARDPEASPGPDHLAQWIRTVRSRYRETYVPAPYQPAADVLEISAQKGVITRTASQWPVLLHKPTEHVVLPGDHESVIGREHAPRLARLVGAWMDSRSGNA
ncbi:MAG TPA: hypothetical protein VFO89_06270, partial [Thermoanaerobaculia bacterium]|nr:hypothetical protein [Thermoanaerobaculia bacterium]